MQIEKCFEYFSKKKNLPATILETVNYVKGIFYAETAQNRFIGKMIYRNIKIPHTLNYLV